MKTFSLSTLLVAVLFVVSVADGAEAAAPELRVFDGLSSASEDSYVPGEVVYRFKNDNKRFRTLSVPDVQEAIAALENNPNIAYAEPNFIATAAAVPNDPYYPYQWNFDNTDYGGVHAQSAWNTTDGSGTVVAIVDTGVAYEDHSDGGRGPFKKKYYKAPDLSGTCFEPGYDFVNNDSHANDDNSHGTHVAGTIAQTTNNNEGVAGLAHGTCLMPIKVLDENGAGTYTDVANGIYYATDNGAEVINLSLGGAAGSSVLKDAVAYAYNNGVTVVAASGNDNGPVSYPAAYDAHVIAVGATRYDETRAAYSNYGPSLDIVAPGGDTDVDQNGDGYGDGVLQQTFDPGTKNTKNFGYYFFQGTSMAAPHAAAVAAMVRANGNATTPDEIRSALQESADDLGATGRDDVYGYGLINLPAALSWASGPSDNPPLVSVTTPSDGTTVIDTVSITASSSDDNGVSEVQFYIDGTLLSTDTAAPYEATWDSTSVNDGTHTVTATAVDTASQESSDSIDVMVDNVNDAPVADAGSDQMLSDSDSDGSETTELDGSASYDPDGTIESYTWKEDGMIIATGATSTVTFPLGSHTVTLEVTDDDGATASDTVVVEVTEDTSDDPGKCPPGWQKNGRC